MHKLGKWIIFLGILVAAVAVVAACGGTPEATPCPEPEACPACPDCPEATCPEVTCPEGVKAPFEELWQASAHADTTAVAFHHWDEAGVVEEGCAKCHSSGGFQDYVGADGSEAFVVNAPAAIGTVITCDTCHNAATKELSTVKFPSGAEVTGLGGEAVCMTCHQGVASGSTLTAQFEELGVTDVDAVVADLGFTNIHYFAAAVSRYGKIVAGGFQYEGKSYDAMFDHVAGYQTCTDCHDSHSLEVKVEECAACHTGVATAEDLRDVRMASSPVDYDGDGDVSEGVYYELQGLQTTLLSAIQAYASEVAGTAIAYDAAAYPYFFIDTNADGTAGADEAIYPNKFASWTPRLLEAAYNYQTSIKDPGGYAHGGKYIIQLVYDSIVSLNEAIATPIDLSAANRIDAGHFAGSEEAFRHWDEDGYVVETDCVKCHSAAGLPMFLANGATISVPASNGFMCSTCHDSLTEFTRYAVETVTFPSGAEVGFADNLDANLCISCHQGRQSGPAVEASVAGKEPDVASDKVRFLNVHYFAAGATFFGGDVNGMYQYEGKEYLGQFAHVPGFDTCVTCHDAHALQVNTAACAGCHGVEDPDLIRGASSAVDYDGDGNVTEGIAGEVETMAEKLYAAIQAYATEVLAAPIVYDAYARPYFWADANANGVLDVDETGYILSPRLSQAAYNYHFYVKDPGAFAHNGKYVLQVLYDSIADLGTKVTVDMTGLVRP